jgi:orotidine-5'-phosphate decarboxylase
VGPGRNKNNNCGLVTGATYPEKIKNVRSWAPFLPFLIPGVGKQGGDLEAALEAAFTVSGTGVLVNLSRNVIFASQGTDFAEAAGRVAEEQHSLMHRYWKEKFLVAAE